MRPIMTRAELASHAVDRHRRDYSKSDDGWDDMEVASEDGWHAVSGWGRDGWDLGDWPYVVISVRTLHDMSQDVPEGIVYEMRQTCEGDTDVYRFETKEDLYAAVDYLFVWYGIGREYEEWAVEGLGPQYDEETGKYLAREGLDAGTLRVPERMRGPFSWARCDAEAKQS